ncbi:MAG: alternative ribosome rescue aminoacyl-tRNA hydrolase ArfB [Planctomycetota bacterium]|nr:alternative ribosome rescue aminoacyl-tRNA hydrolase ArfB [Planctomycetota bacterium]
MTERLEILPGVSLDPGEVQFTYACSGGPGGQNVNKVATKAVLRFDLRASPSFTDAQHAILEQRLGKRLTVEGHLVLHASRHRVQDRNRQDALDRLLALLAGALAPQKVRKKTKPSRNAKRRRLEGKRRRGETKRMRRTP